MLKQWNAGLQEVLPLLFTIVVLPRYPIILCSLRQLKAGGLGWYAIAHKYDGFLRWAYDAWPSDVIHDARNMHWNGGAGDCFMVYPGGNSCIRFEKLREGIVDYEKIRILREEASKSHDKDVHNLMQQLDEHLKIFLAEKDFETKKITEDVDKGKKIVEELSDKLGSR